MLAGTRGDTIKFTAERFIKKLGNIRISEEMNIIFGVNKKKSFI